MLYRTHHPLTFLVSSPRAKQRAIGLVSSLMGLLTLSSTARAAPPTIEQCLEASDASLELETQEKLLATRDALRICASLGCPQEVRDECTRRIELLEPHIPSVICEVSDTTGHLRRDALVTIDGQAPATSSHELIELEPGRHSLTVHAPGLLPSTLHLTLKAREKGRRLRFVLDRPSAPRPAEARLSPPRAAALIAGGVGVASLATSSVFAVIALNRKQEAQTLCPAASCSTQAGAERWDGAWQAGNFATGFAVGGVVALGAAAGLWFAFEPRGAALALGPGHLQLKASF